MFEQLLGILVVNSFVVDYRFSTFAMTLFNYENSAFYLYHSNTVGRFGANLRFAIIIIVAT